MLGKEGCEFTSDRTTCASVYIAQHTQLFQIVSQGKQGLWVYLLNSCQNKDQVGQPFQGK